MAKSEVVWPKFKVNRFFLFIFFSFYLFASLISQRLDRIRQRRFDGLRAHRQQRDEQGRAAGKSEDPPADLSTIGEILQPFVHGQPGDRSGEEKGDRKSTRLNSSH